MLLSFTLVANEDRVVAQAVAQQIRSRKDADSVEAQWAMNEATNIEASDKTLEMICALERHDSRAICALDFREVSMCYENSFLQHWCLRNLYFSWIAT